MEHVSLGAGLAALAFWGFVAVAVVAGIWDNVRKRETKHETVRRLLEEGKDIDPKLIEKILDLDGKRQLDQDFKVTALWVLPVAIGLAALGVIIGIQYPVVFGPILGASGLLFCMGFGFLYASNVVTDRRDKEEKDSEK